MPDTPLNPAVVWNLRALADEGTRELRHVVLEPDILHKLLDIAEAVAKPEVNSFDPRELNRHGWTCGCEPGDYNECEDCQAACEELADFLNRLEATK